MIRYTNNTKATLTLIQEYGFTTIRIVANTIFKNRRNGKEQARVTLQRLVDNGDIIKYKVPEHQEFLYQFKKEKVSDHRYYLTNLWSEIYKLAEEIVYFKLEETWSIANKRSDAHIIFRTKDIAKYYLVEFDKFHSTQIDKYDVIYDSEEVHEWYKKVAGEEMFPDVLIIDSTGKTKVRSDRDYNVVCIDYRFTDLLQKVVL